MVNFVLGVLVGIVLSTIGLSGVVRIASNAVPVVDSSVASAQTYIKSAAHSGVPETSVAQPAAPVIDKSVNK